MLVVRKKLLVLELLFYDFDIYYNSILITSKDVSSFHDGHLDEDGEATHIDGERDENYQKILKGLHEKLIDNEHMNILTGGKFFKIFF